MIRSCYFLLLMVFSVVVFAQSSFEFTTPKRLSAAINSNADELMPVLSDDGNTIYFTRQVYENNMGGRFGGQDIWYTEYIKDEWSKSKRLDVFNNMGNNVVVGYDTEHRIYLLNSYEDDYGAKSGLSYSDSTEEDWKPPVITKIKGLYNLEKNEIYGLNVNKKSDVLLISMKGPESVGLEDLYVSFRFTGWNQYYQSAGHDEDSYYWWSKPIHLGEGINSTGYDISPFLTNDGQYLFFASNREGGYGNSDIYYSKRLDDTWRNWSEPVNLGKRVNSSKFDAYLVIGNDSVAYFSSSRSGGFSDIYTTNLVKSKERILDDRTASYDYKVTVGQIIINEPVDIPIKIENRRQLDSLNRIERNILFDHNSSNLLLKDLDLLENCLKILRSNSHLAIHLIGHTDHVGDAESNKRLSHKRSLSVKNYLLANGVENEIIRIQGEGEGVPVDDNTTSVGRMLNRRVEIFFEIFEDN